MSTIDFIQIGKQLKDARISKNMTIEEIAEKTKLRKDQVVSIEEGDLSKLPPTPYVKGFIKLYSKAVGLEIEDASAATVDTAVPPRAKRAPMKRSSVSVDVNGIIFFIVFSIIIALTIFLTVSYFTRPKNTINVPDGNPIIIDPSDDEEEPNQEPVDKQPIMAIDVEIDNNKYLYTVSNQESLEIILTFTGQCWVDIKVDGKSFKNGILRDEELIINADKEVFIVAGLPANLNLSINGEEVEFANITSRAEATIQLQDSEE